MMGRYRTAAVAAVLCSLLAYSLPAQEYNLSGEVELAVSRWSGEGVVRAEHLVMLDGGELSVRHALRAQAAAEAMEAAGETLEHTLYQAALTLWPVPALTVQAGRFTLPWGVGYLFLPGDALHPVRTSHGEAPGFDGAALTWTVSPDLSAAAALRLDGDEKALLATQVRGFFLGVEGVAAVVYREDEILRPSAGVSWALGPVVFHGEFATELTGRRDLPIPTAPEGDTAPGAVGLPDLLAHRTGWALTGGLNTSLFFRSHAVTVLGEYFHDQPRSPGLLYASLSWEWDRRVGVSAAVLWDLDARSVAVLPEARLVVSDSVELLAHLGARVEADTSWNVQDLRLAARIYF